MQDGDADVVVRLKCHWRINDMVVRVALGAWGSAEVC
jgi:hypothetical protein